MSQQLRQNLYRKYRPSRFSELSGQEHISRTIQSAMSSGRLSHAYMFSGPRGTGKTSAARLMAKVLNCLAPVSGDQSIDCCGECVNCRNIEEMNFMDLIEIDAASNNSVEDIRQMREKVKYRPVEGKYKVYIIDEVHMLSGSAFNAFLKTLEEPPENVVFILATTDPQKVPATILSRCQCFDFHSVARKTIQKRLEEIVKLESEAGEFPAFEPEALAMIADCAQGGFRDALSILDQIASSTFDKTVTLDQVLLMTRRLSYATLKEIAVGFFSKDAASVIRSLNDLYSRGYEPATIARDLLEYLRRCMVLKIDTSANQLLELPDEQATEMADQVKDLSVKYLLSSVTRIEKSLMTLKNSFQARILFEADLIRLSLGEEIYSTEALEKRIELLEQKLASIRRTSTVVAAVPSSQRRASPAAPARPKQVVSEPSVAVKDSVLDFRNAVAKLSNICQALLVNARIGKPADGILPIHVAQSFAVEKLKEDKNQDILLKAAQTVFGKINKVLINSGSSNDQAPDRVPAQELSHREQIKRIDNETEKKILSKPSIADAIDVFGGEIVDIES